MAALGIFGLFGAAQATSNGGYVLGLLLFGAAVMVVFNMVKQHFDGVAEDRMFDILPRQPRNGWVLVIALGMLGMTGLFLAAGDDHYLYWFGVTFFAVCCILGFMTMKAVFDAVERRPRGDP